MVLAMQNNLLSQELELRFALNRLTPGGAVRCNGWTVRREYFHFTVTDGAVLRDLGGKTMLKSEFNRLRAIGEIVALVLGDEFAPELAYRNIVRRGMTYEVWHKPSHAVTTWRIVLRAATPKEAHEEYQAWKAAYKIGRGSQVLGTLEGW